MASEDELFIGSRFDIGPIVEGAKTIETSITQSAEQMSFAFDTVTQAEEQLQATTAKLQAQSTSGLASAEQQAAASNELAQAAQNVTDATVREVAETIQAKATASDFAQVLEKTGLYAIESGRGIDFNVQQHIALNRALSEALGISDAFSTAQGEIGTTLSLTAEKTLALNAALSSVLGPENELAGSSERLAAGQELVADTMAMVGEQASKAAGQLDLFDSQLANISVGLEQNAGAAKTSALALAELRAATENLQEVQLNSRGGDEQAIAAKQRYVAAVQNVAVALERERINALSTADATRELRAASVALEETRRTGSQDQVTAATERYKKAIETVSIVQQNQLALDEQKKVRDAENAAGVERLIDLYQTQAAEALKLVESEMALAEAERELAAARTLSPETLGGFYGNMPTGELDKAEQKAAADGNKRPVEGYLPLTAAERDSLENSLGRPLAAGDERLYRRTFSTSTSGGAEPPPPPPSVVSNTGTAADQAALAAAEEKVALQETNLNNRRAILAETTAKLTLEQEKLKLSSEQIAAVQEKAGVTTKSIATPAPTTSATTPAAAGGAEVAATEIKTLTTAEQEAQVEAGTFASTQEQVNASLETTVVAAEQVTTSLNTVTESTVELSVAAQKLQYYVEVTTQLNSALTEMRATVQGNTSTQEEQDAAINKVTVTTERLTIASRALNEELVKQGTTRQQVEAELAAATSAETESITANAEALGADAQAASGATSAKSALRDVTAAGMAATTGSTAATNQNTVATEQQVGVTEAAVKANQGVVIVIGEGIKANKTMIATLELINNSQRGATASASELKEAWQRLDTALEKAGLTLELTAEGLEIVKAEAQDATGKIDGLTRAEGMATAGMMAMDGGFGKFSFMARALAGQIPALASALSYLFAPLIVITFVDIISTAIEKFERLGEVIQKAGTDLDNLTTDMAHQAFQIDMTNLKLDDQISKLTTGITHNGLSIALLDSKMKADELAKSLANDIEKQQELMEKSNIGFWRSLLSGEERTTPFTDELRQKTNQLEVAVSQYRAAIAEEQQAVRKGGPEGAKDETAAREKQADAYKQIMYWQKEGLSVVNDYSKKIKDFDDAQKGLADPETLGPLSEGMTTAGGSIEQMRKQVADAKTELLTIPEIFEAGAKRGDKTVDLAKDTERQKMLKDQFEQRMANSEAASKVEMAAAESLKSKSKEQYDAGIIDIDQETKAFKDAETEKYNAQRNLLAARRQLSTSMGKEAGEDPAKVKQEQTKIDGELTALSISHKRALADIDAGIATQIRDRHLRDILEVEQAEIKSAQNGTLAKLNANRAAQAEILKMGNLDQGKGPTETPAILLPKAEKDALDKLREDEKALSKEYSDYQKDLQVAEERAKIATKKQGSAERAQLEKDLLNLIISFYTINSTQYFKEIERQLAEHRRAAAEHAKIEQDNAKAAEQIALIKAKSEFDHQQATETQIMEGSEKSIKAKIDYENEVYEITKRGLEKQMEAYNPGKIEELQKERLDIIKNSSAQELQARLDDNKKALEDEAQNVVKLNQLKNQEEVLEAQHQARLTKIHDEALKNRMQLENAISATMERALSQMLQSMITGYKDFVQALNSLWRGILADFANFLAKKLQIWIEEHILEKIWAAIFGDDNSNKKKAAEEADRAKTHIAANEMMAISDAGLAAAGTFAYYSAIAPPIAPEMAAEAWAEGMSWVAAAAFDNGGIMPQTGMALVHQNEGVLTAPTTKMLQTVNSAINNNSNVFNSDSKTAISEATTNISKTIQAGLTEIRTNNSDTIAPTTNKSDKVSQTTNATTVENTMSFEHGGITPSGVLTSAILHPREMVLDSKLSQGIQNIALNNDKSPINSITNNNNVTYSPTNPSMTETNTGHTFHFNVQGGNQDPQQIANDVMVRVRRFFGTNGVMK